TNLRVYENFAIELPDIIKGMFWRSLAVKHAKATLAAVFPSNRIDPRAKVSSLSLSQQQMIEVARAASHPATRLLILDEPTPSLTNVQNLMLRGFSLEVGRGEIVGLAGLEGSGQRQVLRSIFGRNQGGAGSVRVEGRVAFVSGDRVAEGIFPLWSIDDNIAIS